MTTRLANFLYELARTRGRAIYSPVSNTLEDLRNFQAEVDELEDLQRQDILKIVGKPHQESSTGHRFVDRVLIELTGNGVQWLSEYSAARSNIPEKLDFTIEEVCDITGLQEEVLIEWESEFPMLTPQKNHAGQSIYRKRDVEVVLLIKELLYEDKYTIAGAKKKLSTDLRGASKLKVVTPETGPTETVRSTKRTSPQPDLRTRTQVFFSYSRKDKKWLELFQTSLRPLIRANQISVWDDTKIKVGDDWKDEIKQALASAKVAVLLVSRNFLASDFIAENELPPLLKAAQNEGLKIILVIVGHSLFEETEIGRYQAVNDPSRPLASITAANREKEIVRICREIKAAATLETSKDAIRQIDFVGGKEHSQLKQIESEYIKPVQDKVETTKESAKVVVLQSLSSDSDKGISSQIISLLLMKGRPMTFKEIADKLGDAVTRRNLTYKLSELVRAGIVERSISSKYSNSFYKLRSSDHDNS